MKNDDFYDLLYDLADAHRKLSKWRWVKARRLRKEINRRWHQFIKEISDEHEKENEQGTSGSADQP